jgi:predicted negative regulator of RcsB-dependent stress response
MPISEVVRRVIAERGVEDALREYRALRETRFNEHVFDESELESLARELSEKDQAEAAIALAALNLEQFPWSAQAHFVLGDLLAKADRCDAARREYLASFEIDRSFSQPEDRLARLKLCGGQR